MNRLILIFAIVSACLSISPFAARASRFGQVTHIACAPADANTAAVVADNAVQLTLDSGNTWIPKGRPQIPKTRIDTEVVAAEEDSAEELQDNETSESNPALEDSLDDTVESGDSSENEIEEAMRDAAGDRNDFIAVDDIGNVAWVENGMIAVVSHSTNVWRVIFKGNIRQVAFDNRGNLFALEEQAVLCFSAVSKGVRLKQRLPLRHPIALLHGYKGGMRVFNRNGVFSIEEIAGRFWLKQTVKIVGGIAAALRPLKSTESDESWIVAAAGKVVEVDSASDVVVRFTMPEVIETLLVNAQGEIRFYSPTVGRLVRCRGRFEVSASTTAAVDAAGRYWESGPSGLVIPGEQAGLRENRISEKMIRRSSPDLNMDIPVPPRCTDFTVSPLPEISLSFSLQHGATLKIETGDGNALYLSHGVFFGALLTWRIGSADKNACISRHRRFQAERLRLNRRRADLENLMFREEYRALEISALKEAVASRMARAKIEALLLLN